MIVGYAGMEVVVWSDFRLCAKCKVQVALPLLATPPCG